MKLSRLSLIYLASYLLAAGLGFLFIPTQFSKLLFSNVVYQEVPLRLAGTFSLLLGILVAQIVRYKIEVLYATSVFARGVALIIITVVYFQTRNPMFISLFLIVALGVTATIISFVTEKRSFKL